MKVEPSIHISRFVIILGGEPSTLLLGGFGLAKEKGKSRAFLANGAANQVKN